MSSLRRMNAALLVMINACNHCCALALLDQVLGAEAEAVTRRQPTNAQARQPQQDIITQQLDRRQGWLCHGCGTQRKSG